jgi:hypothetical protein
VNNGDDEKNNDDDGDNIIVQRPKDKGSSNNSPQLNQTRLPTGYHIKLQSNRTYGEWHATQQSDGKVLLAIRYPLYGPIGTFSNSLSCNVLR